MQSNKQRDAEGKYTNAARENQKAKEQLKTEPLPPLRYALGLDDRRNR